MSLGYGGPLGLGCSVCKYEMNVWIRDVHILLWLDMITKLLIILSSCTRCEGVTLGITSPSNFQLLCLQDVSSLLYTHEIVASKFYREYSLCSAFPTGLDYQAIRFQ